MIFCMYQDEKYSEIIRTFWLSVPDIWLINLPTSFCPGTVRRYDVVSGLLWELKLATDPSLQYLFWSPGKELYNFNGWTGFVDRTGGGVTGFSGSFRLVRWYTNLICSFLLESTKCLSASSWMGLCFLLKEKMNPLRPSRNSSRNCEDIFLLAHREITNWSSSSSFV